MPSFLLRSAQPQKLSSTPIDPRAQDTRRDLVVAQHKRGLLHPHGRPMPAASASHDGDVNFPPPDIDEAAGFIGRLPFLGSILGRLLIFGGGAVATHAASHARHDIVDDWKAAKALKKAAASYGDTHTPAARAPFSDASRRKNRAAMAWLAATEAPKRLYSSVMNVILAVGSAGMGFNLLAGAEIAGAFVAPLVPWANLAMDIAVPFMGIYGAMAAYRATADWLQHGRDIAALNEKIAAQPEGSLRDALQQRVDVLKRVRVLDIKIATSGVWQAVGAPLQAAIGPIGLLVLLPGTFGLGIYKFKRDTLLCDTTLLPLPNPETLGNKKVIAERVLAAHDARLALTTGRASAWGLLRTADGALRNVRGAMSAPGWVPPYQATRFTRDMLKQWCSSQLTYLTRERDLTMQKALTWADAGARIATLNTRLQTLTAYHQALSIAVPEADVSVVDLVGTLLEMDLYKPFAMAALRDKKVRAALNTPWDGMHYWLDADHLVRCVRDIPGSDAAIIAERLHELAREVLWGQGAYGAARDEANLGAVLQQRALS